VRRYVRRVGGAILKVEVVVYFEYKGAIFEVRGLGLCATNYVIHWRRSLLHASWRCDESCFLRCFVALHVRRWLPELAGVVLTMESVGGVLLQVVWK